MVEIKNGNPEIVNTQTEPEIIAENPLGTTSFSASRDISAETSSFTTIVSSNGELSFHIEAGPDSSGSISLNLADIKLGGTRDEDDLTPRAFRDQHANTSFQEEGNSRSLTTRFSSNIAQSFSLVS